MTGSKLLDGIIGAAFLVGMIYLFVSMFLHRPNTRYQPENSAGCAGIITAVIVVGFVFSAVAQKYPGVAL